MDRLMLAMLRAVAEYERVMILERQQEGIANAKAKGVYRGRPRKFSEAATVASIVAEALKPGAVKAQVARAHGISRENLHKYIREARRQSA